MLAQRERALCSQFANVGGRSMNDVDLVRNLLLSQIADDQERASAYETYWLPMERAKGDGNPEELEDFIRAFVRSRLQQQQPPTPLLGSGQPMGPPPPKPKPSREGAQHRLTPLLDEVARLIKSCGGSAATSSLYQHGTSAADTRVVDSDATGRVAIRVMLELRDAALGMAGLEVGAEQTSAGAPHEIV